MSLQTLDKVLNKTSDRSVGDLVAAYGSNIQKLKMDAATGKIDPTKAVMAMMTIQRIVAANTQPPPNTTVAQDVGIAPPPQPMMPPPAAPQQAPVQMAYGGQVAISNNQVPSPAMERGLDGIPVPDNMFDYAGGGMVAFADGGNVKRFQNTGAVQLDLFPETDRFGQPKPRMSGAPRPAGTTFAQAFPSASTAPTASPSMFSRGLSFLGRMVPGAQALFTSPDLNANEAETLAVLKRLYELGFSQEEISRMKPDEAKRIAVAGRTPEQVNMPPAGNAPAPVAQVKPPVDNAPTPAPARAPAAPTVSAAKPMDVGPEPMLSAARSAAEGTLQAEGGKDIPAVPTLAAIRNERVEQLKAEGYEPDLLKDLIKENRKNIEGIPQKRQESANLRLLEAGLAILGGASPHAFVNIGKGAEGALKGYAQDIKELDKLERDYKHQDNQIRILQNKEAADFTKADQARLDKAIERRDTALDKYNLRVDRLAGIMYESQMGVFKQKMQDASAMARTEKAGQYQLQASQISASRPSQLSELASLFRSQDPRDRAFAESYIGQGKLGKLTYEEALKIVKADPMNIRKSPEELSRLAKEYVRLGESGAEATPARPPANRAPLSSFGS